MSRKITAICITLIMIISSFSNIAFAENKSGDVVYQEEIIELSGEEQWCQENIENLVLSSGENEATQTEPLSISETDNIIELTAENNFETFVPLSLTENDDEVTLMGSITWRLHVWISNTGMGRTVPETVRIGDQIYLNYEILDVNDKALEPSDYGWSFSASEYIYNTDGSTRHSHTYSNSRENWIGVTYGSGSETGLQKGKVVISGDISNTVNVSWQLYDTIPKITSHPSAKTVTAGDSAYFGISGNGTHASFQWYYSTSSTGSGTAISGATSNSYTINSTTLSMNGRYYYCAISNYGNSTVYSNRAKLTVNPRTYTLSYNANGGTGAPTSQTKTEGTTLTLSSTLPTRFGYTFLGWSTSSSASSASYLPSGSYTNNSGATLYAVWSSATNLSTSLPTTSSVKISVGGTYRYFKFTPSTSGTYIFESTLSSGDSYGYLYNSSGTELTKNDDEGDGNNFKLSYNLTAGTTYYFAVRYYSSSTTGTIPVKLSKQATNYTITYDYSTNGGTTATKNTASVASGNNADLTPTATKSGWTFVGWNTNQNATVGLSSHTVTSDVTLYAIYKKTLTASFYYGNNSLQTTKTVTIYNNATSGSITTPSLSSYSGWSTVGWRDDTTVSTKEYSNAAGVSISSDTKFYGIYSRTLTLSYNANGGSSTPASQTATQYYNASGYTTGVSFILAPAIAKSGYTFNKWAVGSVDGTTTYSAGSTIAVGGDTTVYATWITNSYTLTYNANGGKGAPSSEVNATIISSTIPTYFPCTFLGWSKSSSATSATYLPGASITQTGDTILYAVWASPTTLSTSLPTTSSGNISIGKTYRYFKFTPSTSGTYIFESTLSSGDSYGYLYNSSGTELANNDDGGSENGNTRNFKISYELTAGTTYYFGVRYYSSSTTGTIPVKLSKQATSYTITYDYATNGGTSATKTTDTVSAGETADLSVTATKNSWEFVGWNTDPNATEALSSYIVNGNATLYAIWKKVAIASGTCGENVTWSLDDEGVLTISGTGSMDNYTWSSSTNRSPIYEVSDKIEKIVINYGVTSIGSSMFMGCENLAEVSIPNSVTRINSDAFMQTSLRHILIPDSVTTIGSSAFYNSDIENIEISQNITSIGVNAFSSCNNLSNITVNESNAYYSSIDGNLFNKDATKLISYALGKTDASYEIPNSVTCIGDSAFAYADNLTNVTIPNSVINIESNAFERCKKILKITIPDSVEKIGYWAFYGCDDLTIIEIGAGVTKIDNRAFGGYDNLVSITVNENNANYSAIDGVLFNKQKTELISNLNTNETAYTIPDGVMTIESYAFYSCDELTSVTIPESITRIKDYAFYSCDKVTDVFYCGTEEQWNTIVVGSNNTYLTNAAVHYLYRETYNITYDYATNGGTSATKTTDTVNAGDTADLTVTAEKDGWEFVGWNTNPNATEALSSYIVNGNVTLYAIWKQNAIASGTCGENANWVIDNQGTLTISGIGVMDDYSYSSPSPWYNNKTSIKQVVIEKGITTIGDYAFYNCTNLTNITIPDSVTSVGKAAIHSCNRLTNITIPEGVTSIKDYAFQSCGSLKSITIPNSLTDIGYYVFSKCNSLETVNIKDIKAWCSISFGGYESNPIFCAKKLYLNNELITDLIIPEGVTSIASYAFNYCDSLTNVSIPDSVTYIGSAAFSYCSNLSSADLPDSVTSMGYNVFSYCSKLSSVDLPDNITAIINWTFRNCSNLTDVIIPESVTTISQGAFLDSGLESITIPNSVTNIVASAFEGCENLTDVYYNDTKTKWNAINIGENNDYLTDATIHYLQKETYNITYDYATNGGTSASKNSVVVENGNNVDLTVTATKTGWEHIGWNTNPNAIVGLSSYTATEDTTLYAIYRKIFDVMTDSYIFDNTASSFNYTSTSHIPWNSYKLMLGNNIKAKAQFKAQKWSGNCCGMSSTISMMYANEDENISVSSFSKEKISDIGIDSASTTIDDFTALSFIEAMQVSQYTEQFASVYNKNKKFKYQIDAGDNLNNLYTNIKDGVTNAKNPIIVVGITGYGAHALLAYKVEEISDTESHIYLYDCNHPLDERYMTLTKNASGDYTSWSYDMGHSFGIWGFDTDNAMLSYISYIPYDTIKYIWDNRGNLYNKNVLLSVSTGDISIYNFDGDVVAEFQDGKFISYQEDVYEVPNLQITDIGINSVYLPNDLYTVVSNEEKGIKANIVDLEQSATVETTADTISFAVDDDTKTNQIYIDDASAEDTFTVSLDTQSVIGNSVVFKNVTISGSGQGEEISIALDSGNQLSLSNCTIGSLIEDGEEKLSYTITAYAGKGGTITPSGDCKIVANKNAIFKITPNIGYVIKNVLVDGYSVGDLDEYEFTNVTKDHNITATFQKCYEISSASFNKNTLTANIQYVSKTNASIWGAIYTLDGKMIGCTTKDINANSTNTTLQFTQLELPANYVIKIFMFDSINNIKPLCTNYEIK